MNTPRPQSFLRDETAGQHGVADCVANRVGGQETVRIDHVGVEGRLFVVAGPGALRVLGPAFAGRGLRGGRRDLRIALGGALHRAVQRLGAVRRDGVVPPGFLGGFDDLVFGEAKVVDPAAHMGFGGPAFLPGGQGAVRIDAHRAQ